MNRKCDFLVIISQKFNSVGRSCLKDIEKGSLEVYGMFIPKIYKCTLKIVVTYFHKLQISRFTLNIP